jgi:hypothetical protein
MARRKGSGALSNLHTLLLRQQIAADLLMYHHTPSFPVGFSHTPRKGNWCSAADVPGGGALVARGLLLAQREKQDAKPPFMKISELLRPPVNHRGYRTL